MQKIRLRPRYALPAFAVLMLASALATAVPPVASGAPAAPAAASGAPLHPGLNASSVDGGKPIFVETQAQHLRRVEYIDKTVLRTRDEVLANNKAVTPEEREAVHNHWRTAMRLLRIRDLAEDDKARGHVARVDIVMDKVDERFFEKLKDLNAKAPARTIALDGGAK